jgi:hypothetical protein
MLLVNIQLALMGIVLVAGLFYLWRMICRVERRVDDFITDMSSNSFMMKAASITSNNPNVVATCEDEDDDADAFMDEVFGSAPLIITALPSGPKSQGANGVEVCEVVDETKTGDCAMSEVSVGNNGLSKTKLKRMSIDSLKEVCKTKGLSTEGTKTALLDRIMETIDDE